MSEEPRDVAEVPAGLEPEAVAAAEKDLRRYGLVLGGAGVGGVAMWLLHAFIIGFPVVPMGWLGVFLVALVLSFFFPQTRKARIAREILRHWDKAEVRRILEASGTSTDPRLVTAERMARRIVDHPATTDEIEELATSLLSALREITSDQRTTEVVLESRHASDEGTIARASLRDALDYLEARAGRVLGALAELHAAVVQRDTAEVGSVLAEATEVLAELRALNDVDRMLEGGEGE